MPGRFAVPARGSARGNRWLRAIRRVVDGGGRVPGDGQGVGIFFKRGTQKPGGVVQLIGEPGGLCLLKEVGELR